MLKSGTDFRNLSKVLLEWPTSGPEEVKITVERVDLDSSYPEDDETKEIVTNYLSK